MSKSKRVVRRANAWLERQKVEGLDLPHFKITFDNYVEEMWLRFRLIPTWKFNWKIFEKLQSMYIKQWLSKSEATKIANKSIIDFYTAASECSKEWTKPFKVYISLKDIDQTKNFINKQL